MKYLLSIPLMFALGTAASAQDAAVQYQLSTHILDISTGEPAPER